jgi:hypothetical protein
MAGTGLEVFWAEGDALTFPEVRFERPAAVVGLRVAQLTARARELLARSVERRAHAELGSLSKAEWAELDALGSDVSKGPVEFTMETKPGGGDTLVVRRRVLTVPWLYLFGVEYDDDRRFAMTSLLLIPSHWTGPLPE